MMNDIMKSALVDWIISFNDFFTLLWWCYISTSLPWLHSGQIIAPYPLILAWPYDLFWSIRGQLTWCNQRLGISMDVLHHDLNMRQIAMAPEPRFQNETCGSDSQPGTKPRRHGWKQSHLGQTYIGQIAIETAVDLESHKCEYKWMCITEFWVDLLYSIIAAIVNCHRSFTSSDGLC